MSGGLGVGRTMWAHSRCLLTPVKNLPAVQETWVQSLGKEDPLKKGMATHQDFFLENSMDKGAWWGYSPWSHKESDMAE